MVKKGNEMMVNGPWEIENSLDGENNQGVVLLREEERKGLNVIVWKV